MKRFTWRLALCLLLCAVVGLTGCNPAEPTGGEEDAKAAAEKAAADGYALYQDASENMRMLANIDQLTEGTVKVTVDGETKELRFTLNLQLAGDPITPLLAKSLSYTRGDAEHAYTMYDKADRRYYSDGTQKYYESITAEQTTAEATRVNLPALTFAAFEQTVIEKTDALTTAKLTVEGERLEGVLLAEDGFLAALLDEDLQLGEETYLDTVTLQFSVNPEGFLVSHSVRYTVHQQIDGEDSTVDVSMSTFVRHPGTVVKIEFPDFSDYGNKADLPGNTMDGETLVALTSVLEMLYDNNGNRVEQFTERYSALCVAFGQEAVDAAVAWYEAYLQEAPGDVG